LNSSVTLPAFPRRDFCHRLLRLEQCKAVAMAKAMVSMHYIEKTILNVRQRKSMSATGQSYARHSTVVPSFNEERQSGDTQPKLGVVLEKRG